MVCIVTMAPERSSTCSVSALRLIIFAHKIEVAMIISVLVWLLFYRDGFAFRSVIKAKIFNLHPLLMVLGFVLFSGEAIMAYNTVLPIKKNQIPFHLAMHFVALVAGIVGIYAVFMFHNKAGIPNMYSFHSWLGMSSIRLFSMQWLFSFFAFFYPRVKQSTRARLAPWHAVFGIVIFSMAILSALTGLMEEFTLLQLSQNQEALVVNFIGLFIFMFAVSVCLSVILQRTD